MEPYYKFYQPLEPGNIIKMPEQMWIPMNEANSDYQTFLLYLSDNNLTIDDIPLWEP